MRTILALTVLITGSLLANDLMSSSEGPTPTVMFYGDGTKKSSSCYVEGLLSGPNERFYRDGTPQWRGQHERGLREGEWLFWTPDGELDTARSGRYSAGRKVD